MSTGSAHDAYEPGRGCGAPTPPTSSPAGASSRRDFTRSSRRPLPPDVWRLLHRLRLRYIRSRTGDPRPRSGRGWDFTDILKVLLAEEAAGRDRSTREMHRKAARLPSGKTFDAWDPEGVGHPGRRAVGAPTLDWIGPGREPRPRGPVGDRQIALRRGDRPRRVDRDLRVSWFTLESLTATIARSRIYASTGKVVERIVRSELVVVDDIGLLPAGADEAEALYRLVDAAYEKRSLILTSNLHPARFDTIFPKGLATAAVDRLLHHAHVIVTEGRSHRLAEVLDGRGVAPLEAAEPRIRSAVYPLGRTSLTPNWRIRTSATRSPSANGTMPRASHGWGRRGARRSRIVWPSWPATRSRTQAAGPRAPTRDRRARRAQREHEEDPAEDHTEKPGQERIAGPQHEAHYPEREWFISIVQPRSSSDLRCATPLAATRLAHWPCRLRCASA